jgi:hypothetical protein
MGRVLVILLLVLGGLFVAADQFLRTYAEGRAARQVQTSLDLDTEPEVALGGWPFVVKALTGNFSSIEVEVDRVTARGVRLENVRVRLEGVEFEIKDMLAGEGDALSADDGRGSANLTSEALMQGLKREGVEAEVELRDGSVFVSDPRFPRAIEAELSVSGNILQVSADRLPEPYTVRLPRAFQGLEYESVEVVGSVAELTFTLDSAILQTP